MPHRGTWNGCWCAATTRRLSSTRYERSKAERSRVIDRSTTARTGRARSYRRRAQRGRTRRSGGKVIVGGCRHWGRSQPQRAAVSFHDRLDRGRPGRWPLLRAGFRWRAPVQCFEQGLSLWRHATPLSRPVMASRFRSGRLADQFDGRRARWGELDCLDDEVRQRAPGFA